MIWWRRQHNYRAICRQWRRQTKNSIAKLNAPVSVNFKKHRQIKLFNKPFAHEKNVIFDKPCESRDLPLMCTSFNNGCTFASNASNNKEIWKRKTDTKYNNSMAMVAKWPTIGSKANIDLFVKSNNGRFDARSSSSICPRI